MQNAAIITTPASLSAVWSAALGTACIAPPAMKDQAIAMVLEIEGAIDAAPVTSTGDAVIKLKLALTMASRQGLDDDPAWLAVGDALAFLADRA
jgi:hypothetical protein